MTELLERALEAVRQKPAAEQDAIADAMLGLVKLSEDEPADVDPDEAQDVIEALAEVERGDVATPEEVAAAWRSFDR